MYQCVTSGSVNTTDAQSPSNWAPQLPRLCCQAAGGEPNWANSVSAAWFLLYSAARTIDDVQDFDEESVWWELLGPGVAVNTAIGLILTAEVILHTLHNDNKTRRVYEELTNDFYNYTFVIASGQNRDLTKKRPSTKEWWEIATAKAGAPFALACRVGARIATDDPIKVENYSRYGHHLGLLIQVLDDTRDIYRDLFDRKKGYKVPWSLPISYAMEVLPTDERNRLYKLLESAPEDTKSAEESVELIISSGASLYIDTKVEEHRREAVNALNRAKPSLLAGKDLHAIVENFIREN